MLDKESAYAEYLTTRSRIGNLYHRWFLFPYLDKALIGRCLDFGCGIGEFLEYRPGTIGADINEKLIEICISRGLPTEKIEVGNTPFEGSAFDSVLMDNVLEHIPSDDVAATFNEIKRILKPRGTLVIGVPGKKGYASDADHKVYYDKNQLRKLLAISGFELTEIKHAPFYFPGVGNVLSQYCIYATFRRISEGLVKK